MFGDYVFRMSGAMSCQSVLLVDHDLGAYDKCARVFERHGFTVVRWEDDLAFRIEWENALKSGARLAVTTTVGTYVPYDLAQLMHRFDVSHEQLFPKLDALTLTAQAGLDLDFLATAYERDYVHTSNAKATREYLERRVNALETAELVCSEMEGELARIVASAANYSDWFEIARLKARIDVTEARYGIKHDTNRLTDAPFQNFLNARLGQLTMEYDSRTPVLVSSAMDFMHEQSKRFAIVVMDGMSEFDWQVLKESFSDLPYEESAVFAMIPTVTSISRQSLLSGKYPRDLASPWTTGKEKNEFMACVRKWNVGDERIAYLRGYDSELPHGCDFAAIVIMDVDERVHGQYGGRTGMLQDDELLRKSNRLSKLVGRLVSRGLDVYITADHGNTPCLGQGRIIGTGIETESKGSRMLVVNDLADVSDKQDRYSLIEYPGTFLNRSYRYYVCPSGVSFDNPGENVMSHGGMTIDEVIVPFITVKASALNG